MKLQNRYDMQIAARDRCGAQQDQASGRRKRGGLKFTVIPGCASWRRPGIHFRSSTLNLRGYKSPLSKPLLCSACPASHEGRSRSSQTRGGMRWPLRRSSPECRKAHRVTTAPEADGERRVLSRLGRPPTRWEPGPALAIVVSARGKGRVGGKREPGKRRKPGAFAGGATHDAVPTTACGTPDVTGATVVTNSCAFYLAHEAADASSIRRSARPHLRAEERGLRAPPRLSKNRGNRAWLFEN